MSEPVRVALIGTGYFARFHLDAWLRLPGAELAGICDLDPQRLREAAALAPQAKPYADAAAMLDELALDLVDVATPPATHLELVRLSAARSLATICQKPLAPDFDEAELLVELAEQSKIMLAVHENVRFAPWHQEIKRLIGDGVLGTPHGVTMRLRPGDGQGPRAYLDRQPYFQQMERFLIHETAIHWIDTFRFLMGEASGVFARLRRLNPAVTGEDAGIVLFTFAGGGTGLFDGNRLIDHVSDNPRRTMGEMWVEGSGGVLRLDGQGRLWLKPHGQAEAEHRYHWRDVGFAGDAVHATQAHVLAHLRDGAPLHNSGHEYLRNLVIEEAIYRSAAEGRWVKLPPPSRG